MKQKIYVIEINIGDGWCEFDGIELTKEQADTELARLKSHFKSDPTMRFRKKFIREEIMEMWSVCY